MKNAYFIFKFLYFLLLTFSSCQSLFEKSIKDLKDYDDIN